MSEDRVILPNYNIKWWYWIDHDTSENPWGSEWIIYVVRVGCPFGHSDADEWTDDDRLYMKQVATKYGLVESMEGAYEMEDPSRENIKKVKEGLKKEGFVYHDLSYIVR